MTLNVQITCVLLGGKYMCPSLERQYRRTRSLNRVLNTEDESPNSFKMTIPSDEDPCFDFFVGEHGRSDDVSDWFSSRDLTRSSKPIIRSLSFSNIAFTSSFLALTWLKTLERTVCNREEINCCRRSSKGCSKSPRRAPPRPRLPLPLSVMQRKIVIPPVEELWNLGVLGFLAGFILDQNVCLPPLRFGIKQQSWTFQASSTMPTKNHNEYSNFSTTIFGGNHTNSITTRVLQRFNQRWYPSPLFWISSTRTKRRHHSFKSFSPQSTEWIRRTHRWRWWLWWRTCVPHDSWSRQRAKWLW